MNSVAGCRLSKHLVVAVVYDHLGLFEFGITAEIFGLLRPEFGPDWYSFAVAAAEPGPLRTVGGVKIHTDGGLELLADAQTIIVPSWRNPNARAPQPLLDALAAASGRGARIVSICAGAFVLAQAGLLNGRSATTHWRHVDALSTAYPAIDVHPDRLYVDEDDILTSAGSAAGIDLCLHIVRKDFGAGIANAVARRLVMSPHRDGGQAQFIETPVPASFESSRLGPLLEHMRVNLAGEHSISSLAHAAGMSTRTFLRRFIATTGQSPGEWLTTVRIERARELLETSSLSVDQIASLCGFGSAAVLRHHFRKRLSTTPNAYRHSFGDA